MPSVKYLSTVTNKNLESKKIFIGVSWPYANGNIHIGHLAGQYVVADIFARYHRLRGNQVLMVSGSDSHGAPVVFKAEQEGIPPAQLAEQSHQEIVSTYNQLGFIYENYTKTTNPIHHEVAQNVFTVLNEQGYLKVEKSWQYYDEEVDRFLPDRYVRGTCPNCGATNARGDECPECGAYLEPEQLIDPYSTLSNSKPILKETEHFYMDLSALEEPIGKWLKEASKVWRKWVREFSLGWVKQGLEPRPVTRDMKFGVPVPVEGWEDKVLYVWIEAVIGYLSAAIEWASKNGDPSSWEDFWKDPECKHFYFIAGGNVPFHTILWPAELIAYNERYSDLSLFEKNKLPGESTRSTLQLPYNVPANSMLFYKGKKMSKGDSTGISVETLLEEYGADALRYFFVKYAPEKQDREFIWKDFIEANNSELVGNLGNFIYRTLSFTWSAFGGVVPEGELDDEVKAEIEAAFNESGEFIESCEFVRSIERVLQLGHFANKYFNDSKPWEDIKSDKARAANTIFNSIQIVNAIRTLLKPYTPSGVDQLTSQLNLPVENDPNQQMEKDGTVSEIANWWKFEQIPSNSKINKPEVIFKKFEYTAELEEMDNPASIENEKATNIQFHKDEKLSHIPTLWATYTGIKAKKLKPDQREELNRLVDQFIAQLTNSWQEDPKYKGYIHLHDQYSEEKGLPGSVQLLIEKILQDGSLPKINGLVDIYNYVSIATGVSIGVHDLAKVKGDPRLSIASTPITYKEIGSGNEGTVHPGEYAYLDEQGVLCRLDIKQALRTRVSEKTNSALVIFQGHDQLPEEKLDEAKQLLEQLLKQFEIVPA